MHPMGENSGSQRCLRFLEMMSFRTQFEWFRPVCAVRMMVVAVGLMVMAALTAGPAYGSAALLLEMPYGSLGTFNPTGHAALYFDHVCAETPLKLRPCRAGELGVVVSRYDGIGTFDWVAVPLVPYLYGVREAADIPTSVDKLSALRIRDMYRREYLQAVAPDTADGGMPQGNWYELAGSAFDRDIYGFELKTTEQQDAQVIAYFNDRPNVTRYEGAFRNCADFGRIVLNRLYPGAIRRNYVADFGLTTPKSVARGLVHYGRKHPELELRMFRVPQLEGTIPRSMSIQGVTGSLLTRYAVPMAILSPHVTAVVLVAYLGKGRFAVPKNAPILDVAKMEGAPETREPAARPGRLPMAEAVDSVDMGTFTDRTGEGAGRGFEGGFRFTEYVAGSGCNLCDAMPLLR